MADSKNIKDNIDLVDELNDKLREELKTNKEILETSSAFKRIQDAILNNEKEIEKALNNDLKVSNKLVKQNEKLLKKVKKLPKLLRERNNLAEQHKATLKDSLGLNNEIFQMIKKGAFAALGFMVFAKIVNFLKDMVGSTIELQHEMGVSAKQAVIFQTNILGAKASVDGMLFSMDELTASAKSVVEATGRINISPETITNVTELTKLLGDASEAVSLERSLKTAGINSKELVEGVKEMAQGLGMDAGPAMEFLASNQLELQGMTQKQVLTRAREGLLMKQMGVDMKKMKQLASESLDIESSMRNEMKLRMITGKEINLNELRAAQASGDAFAVAQAQQNLVATLGSDLENNLQVQRLISQATGMEAQDLINMKNSQSEMNAEKVKEASVQDQLNTQLLESLTVIKEVASSIKNGIVNGLGAVIPILSSITKPFKLIYDIITSSTTALYTFLAVSTAIHAMKKGILSLEVARNVQQGLILGKLMFQASVEKRGLMATVISLALSAAKSIAMIPIVGPALAVAAGAAALSFGKGLVTQAGDVMSPADGKTQISTKEGGLLELSKNDDVVAAPGLLGGRNGGGNGGGMNLSALISEIKGLRRDIQSQPIMINVDGKVVSAISRVQKRQNSTSTAGYGR